MKDGPISKLIITKTGHQPTQYKKIIDILSVLCADKNYQGIDDVIHTRNNLVEMDFIPLYPNANQWSITHNVKIGTVISTDPAAANGLCPPIIATMEQTHVFDANLQKELLSEFEPDSKIKSQKYSKFGKVPCWDEGFNHNHNWTIQQYNKAMKTKKILERITQYSAMQGDSLSSSSDYAQFVLVTTTVAYHTRLTSKV